MDTQENASHEHAHPHTHEHKKDYSSFYTPVAIIIAGALIGAGIYLSGMRAQPVTNGEPSAVVDPAKITSETRPFIGKADAKVTLYYWYDYQCPFCKSFDVGGIPQITIPESLPTIVKNYVDNGKIKIVFKDFPFLGNDSITGALYKHAMWELYPDKFFAWHEAMMHAQDEEGDKGFGNEQTIVALLSKIQGVDAQKVKAQVAAKKADYMKIINADQQEGTQIGITGTPGFVIGTQRIDGAHPYADFEKALDSVL